MGRALRTFVLLDLDQLLPTDDPLSRLCSLLEENASYNTFLTYHTLLQPFRGIPPAGLVSW